jgi:predicted amidohydrolase
LKSGANVVVLPEQATTGFGITREQAPGLALVVPFRELEPLNRNAKRYRAAIAFGIVEKDGRSGKIYNSAVLIQPNGKLAIQRKRLASSESFGWNACGDTPISIRRPNGARARCTALPCRPIMIPGCIERWSRVPGVV